VLEGAYATETDARNEEGRLLVTLSGAGLEVLDPPGKTVWLKFRRPAPLFTTTVWAGTNTYQEGDVAYWTSGTGTETPWDCYRAELDTDEAQVWTKQEMPAVVEMVAVKACMKVEHS
jgi:hypothetical protein